MKTAASSGAHALLSASDLKKRQLRAVQPTDERITVKGKFLFWKKEKFYIKGVTYGTFAPRENESQFPEHSVIERDLKLMSEHGINCLRTYTVPPKFLLDTALAYGIKVMIGLPWEQHITFLDDEARKASILQRVRDGVLSCEEHPAILCFAIGNEIPAGVVRWYGKKKIEGFLKRLYATVKEVDPGSLVTYVNYPTTEYLDLAFLDFACFNVYLETEEKLAGYIQRLHNLTGNRPLVLAEIGLDSMRNGLEKQSDTLKWQIETIFGKGAAGMFVFAWTDEWWRGGFEIEDWDFGIVKRNREAKPALQAVTSAYMHVPLPAGFQYPFISVVVCSYNGSPTISETLTNLLAMDYPDFEVIVVNDGSKDNLAEIVSNYPVKLITTINQGLSSARNTGMHAAKGEIVAYIDDDAYPDPHWLHYLAYAYRTTSHDCIGGPNIPPGNDGFIATCVANAPGGPLHVLETDEIAEHVPGCNMTFRRQALLNIGGFDTVYRTAGDDVDACWRIQQAGGTIGFHPSAVVWHHRRNYLKTYWKQQKGYGKAEALLEAKWPEKYNSFGHITWAGRIYGSGLTLPIKLKKDQIFFGSGGSSLFQSVYRQPYGALSFLPLMPEWYLLVGLSASLGCMGIIQHELLWSWPVFLGSLLLVVIQSAYSAYKNSSLPRDNKNRTKYYLVITLLHIMQPLARLSGRIKHGLTPWRKRGAEAQLIYMAPSLQKIFTFWSESWHSNEDWLMQIEKNIIAERSRARRGGNFDNWDIEIMNGISGRVKATLVVEEHGAGKQSLKLRSKVSYSLPAIFFLSVLLLLCLMSAYNKEWITTSFIGLIALAFGTQMLIDSARAMSSVQNAVRALSNYNNAIEVTALQKEEIKKEVVIDTQVYSEILIGENIAREA